MCPCDLFFPLLIFIIWFLEREGSDLILAADVCIWGEGGSLGSAVFPLGQEGVTMSTGLFLGDKPSWELFTCFLCSFLFNLYGWT